MTTSPCRVGIVGVGNIDFKPTFAAIRATGYDGWISGDEESGADELESMCHCLQFMRDGMRE